MRIFTRRTAWCSRCVFDLQAHNGSREGQKTRSEIYTLIRPWVAPALMHEATTKACVYVRVCVCVCARKRKWCWKIISAQVHDSNMHLPADMKTEQCALDVAKIQGSFLCSRRLPGVFERQFNDERQHAWMLVFCFRSQGKNRQSQNNFRSLIFFLRCHMNLRGILVMLRMLTLWKVLREIITSGGCKILTYWISKYWHLSLAGTWG